VFVLHSFGFTKCTHLYEISQRKTVVTSFFLTTTRKTPLQTTVTLCFGSYKKIT